MPDNVNIGLPAGWKTAVADWAQRNSSAWELWLFGSWAKGTAAPESDVDFGLALMPAKNCHHRAFGNFVSLQPKWRVELEAIVQRHVSLVPMLPGNEGDEIIRSTGARLWRRGEKENPAAEGGAK